MNWQITLVLFFAIYQTIWFIAEMYIDARNVKLFCNKYYESIKFANISHVRLFGIAMAWAGVVWLC